VVNPSSRVRSSWRELAQLAAVEIKAVKAVIASLEATTIPASVHKKGLGSFTLPGLLKVNVINVPAKKKRTGIDPFTKQERVFAAKPATVKIQDARAEETQGRRALSNQLAPRRAPGRLHAARGKSWRFRRSAARMQLRPKRRRAPAAGVSRPVTAAALPARQRARASDRRAYAAPPPAA
jgi:hypothetical protein